MACPSKPKRLKLSLRKKTSSGSDSRNDSPLPVEKGAISNEVTHYDRPDVHITEVDNRATKETFSIEVEETQQSGISRLREMLRARQTKFSDWHMLPDLPRTEAFTAQVAEENTSSASKCLTSTLEEWIPLPRPDLSWYKPQRKPVLDLASYYRDPDKYVKLAENDTPEMLLGSSLDSFEPKFSSSVKAGNLESKSAKLSSTTHNFTAIKPKVTQSIECNYPVNVETVRKQKTSALKCEDMESMPSTSGSSVLQSCPLCQMEFSKSINQVDIDAHIAVCLSNADDDFKW